MTHISNSDYLKVHSPYLLKQNKHPPRNTGLNFGIVITEVNMHLINKQKSFFLTGVVGSKELDITFWYSTYLSRMYFIYNSNVYKDLRGEYMLFKTCWVI